MIIKTLSRKSNPGQLIAYATRYVLKEGKHSHGKEAMKVLVEHNLRTHSVEGYIAAFKENEAYRLHPRKDNPILFHTILSFAPEDKSKVTVPVLTALVQKFIELRGLSSLHLAIGHFDVCHAHAHIISSSVQTNGYSNRLNKTEFRNLLSELETYQQQYYPSLSHSINTHGTPKQNKEEIIRHVTDRRKTTKLKLYQDIHTILSQTNTFDIFQQKVSDHNYELYYRKGKVQGVIVDNTKYRFSSIGIELENIRELQLQETISDETITRNEKSLKPSLFFKEDISLQAELETLRNLRDLGKDLEGLERIKDEDEWAWGLPP